MSKIPTLFGCPLWKGKLKRRVAKKHLAKRHIHNTIKYNLNIFSKISVGDLINGCSGFNSEIVRVIPEYYSIRGGEILVGVDFETKSGGCSLGYCGIEVEQPREKIEQDHIAFLKDYYGSGQAAVWYGKDSPDYIKQYNKAMNEISIIESGCHICDERGRRL